MDTLDYRCVVVRPQSRMVLGIADRGRYRLPRVQIRGGGRAVREIQRSFESSWGLRILILETWATANSSEPLVAAEDLTPELPSTRLDVQLEEVRLEQFIPSELSEEERHRFDLLLDDRPRWPVTRLGWITEAIQWMQSATGYRFSSSNDVEQWNGGEGFVLFRARSVNGRLFWLKAVGAPNLHEFTLTRFLSASYPCFLPKTIAFREDWNAWITEDFGDPLPDLASAQALDLAARRLAQLQLLTVAQTEELLAYGALDQRLPMLSRHVDRVITYLVAAMARQTSTKVAPLGRGRLIELGEILHYACDRLERFEISDTLIHNDLSASNILRKGTDLVFTDWSEGAIGNPFLTCERLCRLNPEHADVVRNVYRARWSNRLGTQSIDEFFALTSLLAIYAYLYGRGTWLCHPESVPPHFDTYARSLARHLDRAARDSRLLEALCR